MWDVFSREERVHFCGFLGFIEFLIRKVRCEPLCSLAVHCKVRELSHSSAMLFAIHPPTRATCDFLQVSPKGKRTATSFWKNPIQGCVDLLLFVTQFGIHRHVWQISLGRHRHRRCWWPETFRLFLFFALSLKPFVTSRSLLHLTKKQHPRNHMKPLDATEVDQVSDEGPGIDFFFKKELLKQ